MHPARPGMAHTHEVLCCSFIRQRRSSIRGRWQREHLSCCSCCRRKGETQTKVTSTPLQEKEPIFAEWETSLQPGQEDERMYHVAHFEVSTQIMVAGSLSHLRNVYFSATRGSIVAIFLGLPHLQKACSGTAENVICLKALASLCTHSG